MATMSGFFQSMQPGTSRQKTGWAVAGVICAGLCAGYEGFAAHPYVDTVGTGRPITWCYGETKADGPVPPMSATFTKQQCTDMLVQSLVKYDNGVKQYVKVIMGPQTEAAMVDAAYNLGYGVFAHGAMTTYLNKGGDFNPNGAQSATYRANHPHACDALKAYVRAQGRVLTGLVRRRASEAALCHKED
jgi:lysozyme